MSRAAKPDINLRLMTLLFIIITACSCGSRPDNEDIYQPTASTGLARQNEFLRVFYEEHPSDKDILKGDKHILFIPMDAGCEGCLNKSMDFLRSNVGRNDLDFILTVQLSKELGFFKKKFGLRPLPADRVIFDEHNFWGKNRTVVSFPVLATIKNGQLSALTELNASNIEQTFSQLKKRI